MRAHGKPADLRSVGTIKLRAEDAREHLSAETQAQDGNVCIEGLLKQLGFARHEGN